MNLNLLKDLKFGNMDDTLTELVSKLDLLTSDAEEILSDALSIQEINESEYIDDITITTSLVSTIFRMITGKAFDATNHTIDINVITNYGETGEGPVRYTTPTGFFFKPSNHNGINDSAGVFLSFNQDNTVDVITSGMNIWYTNFSIPWNYQFNNNNIHLDFDDIDFEQFKANLNSLDAEQGRISIYNRLGLRFDPTSALLSQIVDYQPIYLMREALDLVRFRDYSASSLLARLEKFGGYENLTEAAKEVYQDIVITLSSKNPMSIMHLFKNWLDAVNLDEEDITFADAPAFTQAFCWATFISTAFDALVSVLSIIATAINVWLGLFVGLFGGLLSAIWRATSQAVDAEYSIAWGPNLDNDSDSRAIDIPFYRGYVSIPNEIQSKLSEYKIVKVLVPGAEVLVWDNDDLHDGIGCIEIRPLLQYNVFQFDTLEDGDRCSNDIISKTHESTAARITLTRDKTVDEIIDTICTEYYDPLYSPRRMMSDEVEYRVASSILLFSLWITSIQGNGNLVFEATNTTAGALSLSVTAGAAKNGVPILGAPPIIAGVGACAVMAQEFTNEKLVLNSFNNKYQPAYTDTVHDGITVDFLNKSLITLAQDDFNPDAGNQCIVNCGNWFSRPFDFSITNLVNPSLWIDNNGNSVAPTSFNFLYRTSTWDVNNNNLLMKFADECRSQQIDVSDLLICGGYKAIPFAYVPKFTTTALIASVAIGAAVAAAIAALAIMGAAKVKKAGRKYQLKNKSKIDANLQELKDAAISGDNKAYNKAYRKYNRSVMWYNLVGSVTGNSIYNSQTGLLQSSKPTAGSSTTTMIPYDKLTESYVPSNGVDSSMTLDTLHKVIVGY